jgi:hypothetical protein
MQRPSTSGILDASCMPRTADARETIAVARRSQPV